MNFFRLPFLDGRPVENVPYRLSRRRRRSVTMRIDADGTVLVSAPYFASQRSIDGFVQKHTAWIARQQAAALDQKRRTAPRSFESGQCFPVWGDDKKLELISAGSADDGALGENEALRITVPNELNHDRSVWVQNALREWYKRETERQLTAWLETYAPQLRVTYRRASVVTQKRRWGSCSRQGDLRFNWRLSMLPPAATEYVVVHELAHLRAMDHSPRFWSIVESVLPDYKERRRLLRRHAPRTEFPL